MSATILSVRRLTKRFGAHVVSDDIHLDLIESEIHAVIGPNGAGKTTLVNQLIGELAPDAGAISFDGRDITSLPVYQRSLLGLSRSYQITSVFPDFSVLENVSIAAQAHDGHSFGIWHPAAHEEALTALSLASLQKVGLTERAHTLVSELAHGERRQLEIAMALVSKSKVLLLDEPMAGMGKRESEEMVKLLSGLKGQYTMLLIEHDMDAVFALADRISVLVYGKIIATGSPNEIRNSSEVRKAYLGESYASA
ncbi:MAG TPA: ABC transporter ATP-binding protein [Xanthobacteraceae bacterium]